MSTYVFLAWSAIGVTIAVLTGLAAARLNAALPPPSRNSGSRRPSTRTLARIFGDLLGQRGDVQTRSRVLFEPSADVRIERRRQTTLRWMEAFMVIGFGGAPAVVLLARIVDGADIPPTGVAVVLVIAVAAAMWASRVVRQIRVQGGSSRSLILGATISATVGFAGIVVALWS